MSAISLEVAEKLSPALRYVAERLEGAGRIEASHEMGVDVQVLVVDHLTDLANSRHDTANRLGASPSGFLGQAADAAAAAGVVVADEGGVSLSIRHPAVARAFRPIQIEPKRGKALAIPLAAMAYNRRPREWGASELFVWKSKTTGNAFLARRQQDKNAPLDLMYLLVRSVTQAQDRSLMPSDDAINSAAARGITRYIRRTLQASGLN